MRAVLAMLLITVPAASGCGKKAREGLPPAEDWSQSGGVMASIDESQRPGGMTGHGGNPHAGVPGAPPLPDDMDGDDPHAGVDMGDMGMPGAGGGGGDPHAGIDMSGGGGGVDVTQLGIPAPDPNRKLDPSHRVAGTIRLDPKVKDRVKANGRVFVMVRRAGPDGNPTGSPLAVERLTWSGDAIPFELTDENAMSAGTELAGDIVVMARYDQDSDALSRQPGDVTGQVRTKVPADKVELKLDTVLP
jgi:hypothetical protein